MVLLKQLFPNVFIEGKNLYTKNLVHGKSFFGEKLVRQGSVEYREWSPFRSKLAAAIVLGLKELPVKPGAAVLYLGAANGYTASFVSDIVGENGVVYCVEISAVAMRDLIKVCEARGNMEPVLADARNPEKYVEVGRVDVLYQDVASREQRQVLESNGESFLGKGGSALVAIKSRSIDSVEEPKKIYEKFLKQISESFVVKEKINLEKFERDHLFLSLKKK